jgi:hypothetical protein
MAGVIARLEAGIAALDQVIEDAIASDGKLRDNHDLLGLEPLLVSSHFGWR